MKESYYRRTRSKIKIKYFLNDYSIYLVLANKLRSCYNLSLYISLFPYVKIIILILELVIPTYT